MILQFLIETRVHFQNTELEIQIILKEYRELLMSINLHFINHRRFKKK